MSPCNTLPHEEELSRLPDYLSFLNGVGVDALIVADLGVIAPLQICAGGKAP